MNTVTKAGNLLIAVGTGDSLLTSRDGTDWTARHFGHSFYLTTAAWTGHQWVAMGYNDSVLTSTDGIAWSVRATGIAGPMRNAAWTGTLLIVASNTRILTAPDDMADVSVFPGPRERGLSLRFASSCLLASLPESLRGRGARVAVYKASGEVVAEAVARGSSPEVRIPIHASAAERYLVKVKAGNSLLSKAVTSGR